MSSLIIYINIFVDNFLRYNDVDYYECPKRDPGRRSNERTVSAFRIARLLNLTFNVVSEDSHHHVALLFVRV